MAIDTNAYEYLKSISSELTSTANRIRNLIGDSHFLTDGHHKEYILQSVLTRFLPAGFICSRGFVVRDNQLRHRSSEQDLLVVDCSVHAPLFYESGVVVTFPESVKAAISVKSTLNSRTLTDALKGLATIPRINSIDSLWQGVFAFQSGAAWQAHPSRLVSWLHKPAAPIASSELGWTGMVACDSTLFVKADHESDKQWIKGYASPLSAAVFIANLMDHLASVRGAPSAGINSLLDSMSFDPL